MTRPSSRGPVSAHRVHGWVVRAPFPLPCPIAPFRARPDAAIRLAPAAPQGPADAPLERIQDGPRGRPWLETGRTGEGFLLRYRGYADFLAAPGGRRVVARPVPGVDRAALRLLLLDSLLPHLMALRGETVLHAAAVFVGGGAVLLLGTRGAGKSTLAALLAREGLPVLSDDAVRLRWRRGEPVVEAGPPVVRLRPDARRLAGRGLGRARPDGRLSGKVRVDLRPRGLAAPPGPRPVRALLVLADPRRARAARAAALLSLRGPEAAAAVADAQFRIDLRDRDHRRREFEAAARLLARVPARRLAVPRGDAAAGAGVLRALAAELP